MRIACNLLSPVRVLPEGGICRTPPRCIFLGNATLPYTLEQLDMHTNTQGQHHSDSNATLCSLVENARWYSQIATYCLERST